VVAHEQSENGAPGDQPAAQRQRDVIVIGASAGGVEALASLAAALPPELPASVLVVLHVLSTGTSVLPTILDRAGALPATSARHGETLRRGHIYAAPPDHHMLIDDRRILLTHGPRENGHRPAVDPLFRSAARSHGDRVIAIVLSGTLDDGTAGLQLVKELGGTTVVQDPEDALYDGMPRSAIDHGLADYVVDLADMSDVICELIDTPIEVEATPVREPLEDTGPLSLEIAEATQLRGPPSGLTCPECGGALWEQQEGEIIRFRCHVGHAYSAESMQAEQAVALEAALWSALRSLEERADFFRRLARRGSQQTRTRFEHKAEEVVRHADAVRDTIAALGRAAPPPEPGEAEPAA
jgi:two-component system, chemotaxis family, protein-glutamate methylesterase/glutaminase